MRSLTLLLVAACSYHSPAGTTGDDQPIIDAPPPDMLPDPMICTQITAECLGSVLRECKETGVLPVDTPCDQICNPQTTRCEVLAPSGGGATSADLVRDMAIDDIAIAANAQFNTDNGQISGVRAQGTGNISGIDFHVANGVGIWRFHKLTIDATITFQGNNAAALVANREIIVNQLIDAIGGCNLTGGGPGAGDGGVPINNGSGGGGGAGGQGQADNASGGAGGGNGVAGSGGAASAGHGATTGGQQFGDATVTLLRGGSGGGSGGGQTLTGGGGGGGGGGIQLVANDKITFIGSGAINAGGCGGKRNFFQAVSGGGGGSGGTILLEAVEIELAAGTILAANGGGGGGGRDNGQSGQDGQLSRTAATGGDGTGGGDGTTGGKGGAGGAPGALGGAPGFAGSSNQNAGGGGGAVGRIRINTRADAKLVGDCAQCSPNFNDNPTTTTRGAADIH